MKSESLRCEMSYDNRLIIKHQFKLEGQERINKLKMVEYVDFVQLFITNGKIKETGQIKYAQFRLDTVAVQQLKEYLENVELSS